MEKNKEPKIRYSQYTKEEITQLDGFTIADLLHEEWNSGKPQPLKDSLLEYENKHRIDYWD